MVNKEESKSMVERRRSQHDIYIPYNDEQGIYGIRNIADRDSSTKIAINLAWCLTETYSQYLTKYASRTIRRATASIIRRRVSCQAF